MSILSQVLLILLTCSVAVAQTEIEELRGRIEQLEKKTDDAFIQSTSGKNDVRSFLDDAISFGGFLETGIFAIAGPDTKTQISASANVLGINIAAEFNERLRFSTQVLSTFIFALENEHNNPRAIESQREFGPLVVFTVPVQGYIEYYFSDAFVLQGGLGYVPFGEAFQERDFVLFRRRGGPQMLSASGFADPVGVVDPLWRGIHARGSMAITSGRLGYDLYTHTPSSGADTLGVGARLWGSRSDRLVYGYSIQSGTSDGDSYQSHGVDLSLAMDDYGITAEAALNRASDGDVNVFSYYAEPFYSFNDDEFIVFLVADYIDQGLNTTTTPTGVIPDPIRAWEYGAGVNWLPFPFTRFRFVYTRHDYVGDRAVIEGQNRDYDMIDLSAGVAF
ncbi:MAG TPA: hypothetical protein VM432_02620 [Bdellovibrionales bacterium]|nr:hypothetical protein [Bdellovibrionales bacterium]